MAYDCLNNLVLLRGVCDQDAQSDSVYLDDIPGVSLKKASLVTDEDMQGSAFVKRIINAAKDKVVEDFITELAADFNFSAALGSAHVGRMPSEYAATFTGKLVIEITKNSDDPFEYLHITAVNFYADAAKKGVVFSYFDGCNTMTCTRDIVCGKNVIPINVSTAACLFRMWVDWTGRGVASKYGCYSACSCDAAANCTKCSTECFNVTAYKETPTGGKIYSNSSELLGFTVNASCRCSDEELVCQFRKDLRYALAYQAHIQFMRFQQNSTNTNYFVTNTKEQVAENLLRLEGGTNSYGKKEIGLYRDALRKVVTRIKPAIKQMSTRCLSCGDKHFKLVSNHP